MIGLIAGWWAGKYFYSHIEKKEIINSNEKKEEKTKLSLDDENIEFLTNLTLGTFYFEHISSENEEQIVEETLFTDKKVNVASLSANFKMSMALSTITYSDNATTISKADMLNAYKKVFGTDDIAESFESLIAGSHGKLTLDGENYKWDRLDWGTDGFFGKRLPYEAYQYDDRIEIDYVFAENNMNQALGSDDFETVEYYAKDGKTVVFSYSFSNMDFDDDQAVLDNQNKFKHYIGTYAKGNDGNYYIVSVEPKN